MVLLNRKLDFFLFLIKIADNIRNIPKKKGLLTKDNYKGQLQRTITKDNHEGLLHCILIIFRSIHLSLVQQILLETILHL